MKNIYHSDIYKFNTPVKSYWEDNSQENLNLEKLTKDVKSEIVVIGGGYTGLLCAINLIENHNLDVILVEAFKSDGIKILDKYNDLYQINESEVPSDIQIFINTGDMAAVLLRIVEIIGQDSLKNIDEDTLYFIISALNQLNADPLRNRILFKVLPLKV